MPPTKTRKSPAKKPAKPQPTATRKKSAKVVEPKERKAKPSPTTNAERYERHKEQARNRQAQIAADGKEIGPLPAVVNPKRRAAALASLKVFLKTYFPRAFRLGFSGDHEIALLRIEEAVTKGSLFALAMPRGRGKTTILIRAAIWAILTGHHRYVMLVGANETKSERILDAIRKELSKNALLLEDFPEICYPIACLKGIHNKAAGQTLDGEPTAMTWAGTQIVLPTVAGSAYSECVIEAAGLLVATRGAQYTTSDGDVIRPSLVLLDDPQTRESARSLMQTTDRFEIITGDLFGLAGPGESITVLCACTAIYQGDLACLLLDKERAPEWRGERFQMMRSFPKNMELWEEYYELRRTALRTSATTVDYAEARQFYRDNFDAMNEGAEVDWPDAIGKDRTGNQDLSAIETAMILFFFNEDSFWAERQNDPRNLLDQEDQLCDQKAIAVKTSTYPKRAVPLEVEHITAFVDVHQKLLYWMVCGWSPSFEGFILDYGAYPKQRSTHFAMSKARPTLMDVYRKAGKEGSILAGLTDLFTAFEKLQLTREDGSMMSVNAVLVDAGWVPGIVTKAIREHPMKGRIRPSKGCEYDESMTPIDYFKPKAGELIGDRWTCPPLPTRNALRQIHFDTGHWKTFVHRRLATQRGDRGCLSIYGKTGQRHDLLARHLCAEFRSVVIGKYQVDKWRPRPGETDNHWLDCLVGCAVAASVLGCRLVGTTRRKLPEKKQKENMAPDADGRVSYME